MSLWNDNSQFHAYRATSSYRRKQNTQEQGRPSEACNSHKVYFSKSNNRDNNSVSTWHWDDGDSSVYGGSSLEPLLESRHSLTSRRYGRSPLCSINLNGVESNKVNFPLTSYHFSVSRNAKVYSGNSLVEVSVEWLDIEAIVVFHDEVQETLCCPICLDRARAPRMTKCGHLFCLLCILKLFSFHDMAVSKCPLCGKKIRLEDLRPVDVRSVAPCYADMEQTMRLVIRRKESFVTMPFFRESWQSYLEDCSIPEDRKEDPRGCRMQPIYSRIFVANEERLLYLLERDEKDVEQMVKEDSSCIPYADYAMEELVQTRKLLESKIRQQRRETFFQVAAREDSEKQTVAQSVDVDPFQLNDFRLFYQAESGQDLYLHPFNIKCLLSYYEHLSLAPSVIRGKVMEVERCTMTEDLKKRMRFLSHLPLGCEFYLVELDLSFILPPNVLNKFARTLQRRAQERSQREEEKRTFQLERDAKPAYEEERKKWCLNEVSFSVDVNEQSFPSLAGSPTESIPSSETTVESSYAAVTSHMGYFPSITGDGGRKSVSPSVSHTLGSTSTEEPNIMGSCIKNKKKKGRVLFSNIPRRGLE